MEREHEKEKGGEDRARIAGEDERGNVDEYSDVVVVVVVVLPHVLFIVFKTALAETMAVFSCDIIHYLKRPLSLSRPS